ncbi:MAG TPA: AAA family ATPase [Devosia sp.]
MSLTEVEIIGLRSIRSIRFPLRRLTVLVGANGVGKTNLYRSLELLHAAAKGTLAEEIAREGGLGSVFWAGGKNLSEDGSFDPKYRTDGFRKVEKNRLMLRARLDGLGDEASLEMSYRIELGFPQKRVAAAFELEAQVKSELLTLDGGKKPIVLMEREKPALWARDVEGNRQQLDNAIFASETALSSLRGAFPEIDAVRYAMSNWRFFHGFRTDRDSPLRQPAPAVTAPMLASDGSNLAAVFATLAHIKEDMTDVDTTIAEAFPGAQLVVEEPHTHASIGMRYPDTPKRVYRAHELSDGTLQFLALMGALLAYRLPPFIALNEPETSLHPSLLPVLARIIAKAAERTQIWVVTHSQVLADAIADESGVTPRTVIRRDGGTWLEGLSNFGTFEDD